MKEKACQFCRFANCAVGLPDGLFVCDRSHQSYTITQLGDCCEQFVLGKSALAAGAHDDIRLIALSKGKFAIVDAADYDWISQWKWCAKKGHKTWYAARRSSDTGKKTFMHRLITNAPDHLCVDQINRNGLNNTKRTSDNALTPRTCTTRDREKTQPQNTKEYNGTKATKHSRPP